MSDWQVISEPALRGYAVEWAEPGFFLLSRRNVLYESHDLHPPFRRMAAFPAPFARRLAARSRLGQRALRFSFYNVLKLSDSAYFVSFAKDMALLTQRGFALLSGLERPCRVLRGGAALHDGAVYFGEYIPNLERNTPIHLYRCAAQSSQVQLVRSFPAGWTRHVHGVFRDPHENALWCCCGDVKDECHIFRTRDGFQTIDTIGRGDETWRAVSLLFTPEALWYAMDAEFEQNRIFRVDRASGERSVVADVDGPVYYSYALGRDLFFAVTAELCPSQQGRSASLWHVDPAGACRRLAAFEKDAWPVRFFQPGSLGFARGPGLPDRFFMTGTALKAADGRTFTIMRPRE